jgi:hypothetical protein
MRHFYLYGGRVQLGAFYNLLCYFINRHNAIGGIFNII